MKYLNFNDNLELEFTNAGQGVFLKEKHLTRVLNDCELFVVIDGVLHLEQNGEKFDVEEGQYFLSVQNVKYGGNGFSKCHFHFIHFKLKSNFYFSDNPLENFHHSIPQHGNLGGNSSIMILMVLEQQYFFENKLNNICDMLVKPILFDIENAVTDYAKMSEKIGIKFQSVAEYLRNDPLLTSFSDIKSMADYFGYNDKYFIRLFKKNIGVSPMQYIIEGRMKRAINMLCDSKMTIKEIADKLGYDYYYFIKLFKKKYGIGPHKYRKTISIHSNCY